MNVIAIMAFDLGGRAGLKFALLVALAAMPICYPSKTLGLLKGAQSSWEQLWTIDGLSGGAA